jgi:hypothetical protein
LEKESKESTRRRLAQIGAVGTAIANLAQVAVIGPSCRYSHDGPKGGRPNENKRRKPEVVFMATKKGKKARKQLSTLLIKDHQENLAKSKDKEGSDLIR